VLPAAKRRGRFRRRSGRRALQAPPALIPLIFSLWTARERGLDLLIALFFRTGDRARARPRSAGRSPPETALFSVCHESSFADYRLSHRAPKRDRDSLCHRLRFLSAASSSPRRLNTVRVDESGECSARRSSVVASARSRAFHALEERGQFFWRRATGSATWSFTWLDCVRRRGVGKGKKEEERRIPLVCPTMPKTEDSTP